MVIGKTGSAEIPTDPMPLEASDIVIVLKSQDQWKRGRSYEELGDAIIERLIVADYVSFRPGAEVTRIKRAPVS